MTLPAPSVIVLDGGLRLVHIHHPLAGAGILGVAVRAGSADERPAEAGLAHFVEHTIFKGTKKRSSWHIINRMEAVGGELNAFTTKEETVLYSIFPSGNAARAAELIADLAINSQFPDKELEKERQVVIDEINSYRDTPSEAIFDEFEEYALAGSPLAHNILGTPDSVEKLGSEDCRGFLSRNYTRSNVVVFYSGPESPSRISRLVNRCFEALPEGSSHTCVAAAPSPVFFDKEIRLDGHQTHTVVGAMTEGLYSPSRHAVSLFANIIGGPGMNSLLNIELRERRGLVYSVEASTAMFSSCGLITVYFGCDSYDSARCRRLCADTFARVADGAITPSRLAKAKKQYLGQFAIASENRENRIMAAARSVLFRGETSSADDMRADILAVSEADIAELGRKMCSASYLTYSN